MSERLLDRIWNRIANRYDGGGECGCGAGIEETGGDSRTPESDADENSKQENAI